MTRIDILYLQPVRINKLIGTVFHVFLFFLFSFFSVNAVLQLHTDVSTFLQHCCYGLVCRFVRSLMAFVCQEIRGLLTYLLTYSKC